MGSLNENQKSVGSVTMIRPSACAVEIGNIDKAIRDHLEILMILRKAFLINILLHSRRLFARTQYNGNVRVQASFLHRSTRIG